MSTLEFSDTNSFLNRVFNDPPAEETYLPLILVNQKEGFDFLIELLNPLISP